MKKPKHAFSSVVLRGCLLLLLCNIGSASQASTVEEALHALRITAPQQRLPAPDFSLPRLAGKTLHLSDYRGKVVLLNFWASFCAPCREEMPALERLWQTYRDQGFVVIAVSADRGSIDPVRDFIKTGEYGFPIALDPDGDVRQQYEVMALPTTYLIGRDGRFAGRVLGAREWDSEQAQALVLELVSEAVQDR